MKKLILVALLGSLTLAACSGVAPITTNPANPPASTPPVSTDISVCIEALVNTGSTDPVTLAVAAGTTSACWSLAGEALSLAVNLAKTHNITVQKARALHALNS